MKALCEIYLKIYVFRIRIVAAALFVWFVIILQFKRDCGCHFL